MANTTLLPSESISKLSVKKLETRIATSMENMKKNSSDLAISVFYYYQKKPDSDTTDYLINLTGLKKSAITQLKKAGEFLVENPGFYGTDYSKAYLLSKLDDDTLDEVKENVSSMTQQEIKKRIKNTSRVKKELTLSEEFKGELVFLAKETKMFDEDVTSIEEHIILKDKFISDVTALFDTFIHNITEEV